MLTSSASSARCSLSGSQVFPLGFAAMVEDVQTKAWMGLHLEWDDCSTIRERMRSSQSLLGVHPCLRGSGEGPTCVERSVHNLRFNKSVLLPAVRRWKANCADQSPSIDLLYVEVDKFYKLSLSPKAPHEVHADAWALRKLMGLLKAQISKQSIPQELVKIILSAASTLKYLYLLRYNLEPLLSKSIQG